MAYPSSLIRHNISDAVAAEILLQRRMMRSKLSVFVKKVFATVDPGALYKHNWHIDYVCEHLEAVTYGEIKKLVINMPPRFLKSIIVSISWPAWELGINPSQQFLTASYSEKLAKKHSIDTRLVIESDWYKGCFQDTVIVDDQNEKTKFVTTKRGYRIATSVGGTATGEGGNRLILDDPINPKKAMSDAEREATLDWIDQTWSTRLNDPKNSAEVLVMQRLHVKDPTGHALAQGGWFHLCLPQEAPKKTIIMFPRSGKKITRNEGELLHEDRLGKEELKAIRKRLGSYGYSGQQQQNPSPMGGGRVKLSWFPRFKAVDDAYEETVFSIDTANKPNQINDPSVIEIYRRKQGQWRLVNIWKDKVAYPNLKRTVISMANRYHPDAILIEDKASGQSLIQELHENTDLPVIPINPEADKITRFDTQTPSLEAGVIALPDPLHCDYEWVNEIEEKLMHFPSPESWDELDAMSQFLKWLKTKETEIDVW